jgi:hypothetical protein
MNSNDESTLTVIGALMIVVIALLIIGTMEYSDEINEQQTYCDMVKDGKWPDYEGTYHEFCEREEG